MDALLPALTGRRATRAFAATPVNPGALDLLCRAVSIAPSHGNTQPTRILVPSTARQQQELLDALSEGNRSWAGTAPLLFALAAVPSHDRLAQDRDGTERELWAFHAGIALGNLLAQGTAMGLVVHPMAGFDEPSVRAVFSAPGDVRIMTVIAAGYPGDPGALPTDLQQREAAPQERLPLERLVVRGTWTGEHGESARSLRRKT